jgi:multidrug transporter EmrE-like cation transporter
MVSIEHGRRPSLASYGLLHGSFIIYSFSGVFSKSAAINISEPFPFVCFLVLELLTLGIYALMWQQVLRRFDLVPAYSSKGIVVIWNLIWAALLFGEQITVGNLIGSCLVIAGIAVVSSDAT